MQTSPRHGTIGTWMDWAVADARGRHISAGGKLGVVQPEVELFGQTWPSTAGPFPGAGGRTLTRRQMLVARIGETAYVYGETFC